MNYANVVYDLLTYNMESATLTIDSNSRMTSLSTYAILPPRYWIENVIY